MPSPFWFCKHWSKGNDWPHQDEAGMYLRNDTNQKHGKATTGNCCREFGTWLKIKHIDAIACDDIAGER